MSLPDLPASPVVLQATGLSLRTRKGPAFTGVDVLLGRGELLGVCGPTGSGRTMLLLTLGGRSTPSAGALRVAGATEPAAIRARTALAPTGGATALEPELTVAAHEEENRLLGAPLPLDDVAAAIGLPLRRAAVTGELPAIEQTLLALALAAARQPAVLLADDVDSGLGEGDRHRVAAALRALAEPGPAVVAVSLDPLPGADHVVELGAVLDADPVAGRAGKA